MTDSILTKLVVVVKDYFAYFLEELKHFYSNRITSSGNYNYSIIGRKVQGKKQYRVKKDKEKIEKVAFFFLSNYPAKIYTNYSIVY